MNHNILGRAPSLQSVTPADLLDGPVSAINGAVFHRAIPADYWVGCDAPHWCKEDPPGTPVVVTLGSNREHWERRFPHLKRMTYDGDSLRTGRAIPWATGVDWQHWSILLALHHAGTQGAKRIRFGGVSMKGDAYAYSEKRVDNKVGPEKRWMRERRELAQAMTELSEHRGIEFDLPFTVKQYVCDECGAEYRIAYVQGPISCACNNGELKRAGKARLR